MKMQKKQWKYYKLYYAFLFINYFQIPAFLPTDKDIRFIKLSNEDKGCMCGGTHVPHLNIINKINVRKINKKGKCVRVAYDLAA